MLLELIEELQMAVKFDEAIAEMKQFEFPCYMKQTGKEPCDEDDEYPCDACKARNILNDV